MLMGITTSEQAVLDLLLEIPPRYAEARTKIKELDLATDSITKVGIRYAEECFLDMEDSFAGNEGYQLSRIEPPHGITAGLHSSHIFEVITFLLNYGLDPNAVYDCDGCPTNIMEQLLYIDNEYAAADTMALLMEYGGDPNLIVEGESIFEQVDFEIWFGSLEQYIRWRYDAWVHIWMVLVAYGGEITGKAPMVKTFKEYNSDEMFDLIKLKNHRDYYYGLTVENNERVLHIFDRKTFWKVAQW